MKSKRKMKHHSNIASSEVLHLLAAVAVVFVMSLIFTALSSPELKADKTEYERYTVKGGDTVWDIADLYYDNSVDIRDMIHLIEDVNGISDSRIYCGDVLLVPVYAE